MLFDTITLIFTSFVSYGRILCCAELHNNLLSYCIFWCCAYQILNEECTYLLTLSSNGLRCSLHIDC